MRPVFAHKGGGRGRALRVLWPDSAETGQFGTVLDRKGGKKSKLFSFPSCHSIQTMEHEFYECPEYLSNTAAAVERTEEYEYEVKLGVFLLSSWTS